GARTISLGASSTPAGSCLLSILIRVWDSSDNDGTSSRPAALVLPISLPLARRVAPGTPGTSTTAKPPGTVSENVSPPWPKWTDPSQLPYTRVPEPVVSTSSLADPLGM